MQKSPIKCEPIRDEDRIAVEDILGNIDADVEWSLDATGEVPWKNFIHTNSYNNFKLEKMLYLFGLRGSGKTAMMKMLCYEISKMMDSKFSYSIVIRGEYLFQIMSIYAHSNILFNSGSLDIILPELQKKWVNILNILGMQTIFCRDFMKYANNKDNIKDYEIIRDFLFGVGFIREKPGLSGADSPKNFDYSLNILDDQHTNEYLVALLSLNKILKKSGPCLILIDSKDCYNLNDKLSNAVLTSLNESIYEIYKSFVKKNNLVLSKIAYPSEIKNKIIIQNQEKFDDHSMFIWWSYADLVSLIAKRFCRLIFSDVPLENKLDVFENAREFINQHFPREVTPNNYKDIKINTLLYIIMHTQKKPRQVIDLLNSILTHSKRKGSFNGFNRDYKVEEMSILLGVHLQLHSLVQGALKSFENSFPNAYDTVLAAMQNKYIFFPYEELDKWLSNIPTAVERESIKKLLVECSVIGQYTKGSDFYIQDIKFIEVRFEYQEPNKLKFSNKTECSIHPMYYNEFENWISRDVIVLPKSVEKTESEIFSRYRLLRN